MTMQEVNPAAAPSAEVVGHAFVEQYYHILHQSPDLVHRFYQDSSFLSRPDSNGVMTTVTTMEAINEKIMSLNYKDYCAEIKTADAQESYEKGVIVVVTGCLTGKVEVGKKFTQTFFLAPQDKGYYVLNDVLRFVEEYDVLQVNTVSPNTVNENCESTEVIIESEVIMAPDPVLVEHSNSMEGENLDNGGEVCDPSENEEEKSVIEEVVETTFHVTRNEDVSGGDPAPAEDDAPKKSYASIVKVMKNSVVSHPLHPSAHNVHVASVKTGQQLPPAGKASQVPAVSVPTTDSFDLREEVEGHSIYVRNLPYDATSEQLEAVFTKFGPIKRDGIQVRSSKGFCFGFVEFEELSSMRDALEASPIQIGERRAVIEEKRTTTRVSGSGRGRYPSGRGGFGSESYRGGNESYRGGRGKFNGGRGYFRNEFRNQEYPGRPWGSSGNSEGSQRATQNGGGRADRQSYTPST